MNRSLLLVQLFVVCITAGCTPQDAAVDPAKVNDKSSPTATSPNAAGDPAAELRDPNSVFVKSPADFLAALEARGYVLKPLPPPKPRRNNSISYDVEGTDVVLGISELGGQLHVFTLTVPGAALKQSGSPTERFVSLLTELGAGISSAEAAAERKRVISSLDGAVKPASVVVGSPRNRVAFSTTILPNDSLRLTFYKSFSPAEKQRISAAPTGKPTPPTPRTADSVLNKPAAQFVAQLQARGYALRPTKLPVPEFDVQGYAVEKNTAEKSGVEKNGAENTSVVLALAEHDGLISEVRLLLQGADLKNVGSPSIELTEFVVAQAAGISREEATSLRTRVLSEHQSGKRQTVRMFGTGNDRIGMTHVSYLNDSLKLSFQLSPDPGPNRSSPSGAASFGTNLAFGPRDPNSVFMHPAADFLAALKSRGYDLTPTQLPEPHPAASGYAVEGTSVTLMIVEEEGKLRVAGLIVPAADLKQADSPAAELMRLVTETVAGVSREISESQRLRVIREHEARVQQSSDRLGTPLNPVMLHYAPGPNAALRVSFTKGFLLSERSPRSPSLPNQTPNPNRPNPGLPTQ